MSEETDDEYSPEETARRRDEVLKVLINTKPQPRVNPSHRPEKRKKAASDQQARDLGIPDTAS